MVAQMPTEEEKEEVWPADEEGEEEKKRGAGRGCGWRQQKEDREKRFFRFNKKYVFLVSCFLSLQFLSPWQDIFEFFLFFDIFLFF